MLSMILALAAASAPATTAERAIIENAVKAEIVGASAVAIGPLNQNSNIVCGRAAGDTFRLYVTRNAAGRVISASKPALLSRLPGEFQAVLLSNCLRLGYSNVM